MKLSPNSGESFDIKQNVFFLVRGSSHPNSHLIEGGSFELCSDQGRVSNHAVNWPLEQMRHPMVGTLKCRCAIQQVANETTCDEMREVCH